MILCREEHAAKIDKAVFPFLQGGPLMHGVAAKAVILKEAAAGVQDLREQVIANATGAGRGARGRRACARSPAAPTPTSL